MLRQLRTAALSRVGTLELRSLRAGLLTEKGVERVLERLEAKIGKCGKALKYDRLHSRKKELNVEHRTSNFEY